MKIIRISSIVASTGRSFSDSGDALFCCICSRAAIQSVIVECRPFFGGAGYLVKWDYAFELITVEHFICCVVFAEAAQSDER